MAALIIIKCVVLICLSSFVATKNLPRYIPICARNSPNFGECLKNATAILQPYLALGIPELNIPSMEPLKVPKVILQQSTSGVNYSATLSNLKIFGLSNYKFNTIRGDVTKGRLSGDLDLPWLRLESRYNISGRVLHAPIEGSGIFVANITKTKADVYLRGHLLDRKGVKYYDNVDTDLKLNIGSAMLNFENLFQGNPNVTMATNMFLNENSNELIQEVKPAVETVAGMLVHNIANKVFRSLPYEKLFPTI